jgi:multidrug resistance efflux pump
VDDGELIGRPAGGGRPRPRRTTAATKTPKAPRTPPTPPAPPPVQAPAAPPPGARMSPRTRLLALGLILLLAVIVGVAFLYSYLATARNFITTDNASIDGDQIVIAAPANGTLLTWYGDLGASFHQGDLVGQLRVGTGSGVAPLLPILAPEDGVVAAEHVVPEVAVTAGSTLATAYNLDQVFVTARVDESEVGAVQPGQTVDISVDAYSTALTGTVQQVEGASAGTFSLLPQSNSTGNFQKVTQEIPVKIIISDTKGLHLVPGMSCTVRIHRS